MCDAGESFIAEKGDLSVSRGQSLDVNLNLQDSSIIFHRYVSAPEFVCRKTGSMQLNSNQGSDDREPSLSPSASMKGFFQSTTFLHACDRPSELPQKDPVEAKRHRIECHKIMQNIMKKHQEELLLLVAEQEKRNANAIKAENRVNYWRNDVIPNWDAALQSQKLHDDWWLGIPSALRSQVWQMIIGNPLGITRDLFEACLTHSQRTIRRLDRERLLAEGFDLPLPPTSPACIKYAATLPSHHLPHSSRIHSMPDEGDDSDDSNSSQSRQLRHVSFNLAGVEVMALPRKIMMSPPTPLAPPPSLSISGDLSSNEEPSLQVIQLDVSRTFPMLGVFQSEGSHLRNLHDLLAAFVAFQPTLGYLQGMSFIAGILLLVMGDIYTAFIAFATLMNRPSFYAFYSLDESEMFNELDLWNLEKQQASLIVTYRVFETCDMPTQGWSQRRQAFTEFAAHFGAFDALLEEKMPRLFQHFRSFRLDSRLYLFDWLFTVFSRSLPLKVDLRIWDLFLRDGEAALILAALGILRMYEDQLLLYDFDHLASFLTGPMPESMSPDILADCMRSLDLSAAYIKDTIKKVRTLTADSANKKADQLSPRSDYDPRAPVEAREEGLEGQRYRWSLWSLRNKQTKPQEGGVNGSSNGKSSNDAISFGKFPSFRRKNASDTAAGELVTQWSQEVCLEFPKREIL